MHRKVLISCQNIIARDNAVSSSEQKKNEKTKKKLKMTVCQITRLSGITLIAFGLRLGHKIL